MVIVTVSDGKEPNDIVRAIAYYTMRFLICQGVLLKFS